jgi:hypothetical protein
MKSHPFRNAIVCLAILLLPAAVRASGGTAHFTGPAASFEGIYSDDLSVLNVTLGANGRFTGKLNVAYLKDYSFSGILGVTGSFTGTIGHTSNTYQIVVTGSTPGTYVLTGSAEGKVITAYPAVYSKTHPGPSGIKYTALFTGTDPSIGAPQGTSFATVNISKTGGGSVTGKLADGTGFSSSGILVAGSNGRELIVFDPHLYGKKGILAGSLLLVTGTAAGVDFLHTNVASELGSLYGNLLWQKEPHKGPYYAEGINTDLFASGYLYTASAGAALTSGTLTLDDAAFTAPITQTFSSTTADVVTMTGAVSGSFEPLAGTKPAVKFKGLLIQYPGFARVGGFFLSPVVDGAGVSGYVRIPMEIEL